MAIYANLSIDQGSSFSSVVTVEGPDGLVFNLTGYTARGQIRKTYTSATYTAFATAIPTPTDGKINISLTATQTAALKAGRYMYDIEIVQGTNVIRVIEGQVEVNPRITKVT